jgi:hypothetical protein
MSRGLARNSFLGRISSNERGAIEVCHRYVEGQRTYAVRKGEYAQRILSTPGKQDGLAWQTSEGIWAGPMGEEIARVIQQGYSSNTEQYQAISLKL